jgi:histidinol-phosphatase
VPPFLDDLALAHVLADTADALTMRHFGSADLQVSTKPDLTPVSEADTAAERVLRDVLALERPDDAVVGEEHPDTGPSDAGRRWVLDPIDGTKNYVRGVPVWATLIALLDGDAPVVGVVSAPAMGRRWWASAGGGAFTRDVTGAERAIHVSAVRDLADASLSYSDHVGWESAGHAGIDSAAGFSALRDRCWRTRAYGDFLSHVLVAEGAVDIAAEPELNPWDIAALVTVVQEAGGQITGYDGSPAFTAGCALTTNGVLHDDVVALLGGR